MFIVYVTSGQYSDFGVNEILIGENDPNPFMDGFVAANSEGLWATWKQLKNGLYFRREGEQQWSTYNGPEFQRRAKVQDLIYSTIVDHLKANGFTKANATELWLE